MISTRPLDVVVLSCGPLGAEVANALRASEVVRNLALVTAPYARKRPTLKARIRNAYRSGGWTEVVSLAARRVGRALGGAAEGAAADPTAALDSSVTHLHFHDLHSADCLDAVRALRPDLAVVAGTYVLKEQLFNVPRLGSINLHSGKVPEYRGSAPAFWELYNGEREVGITIHRVTAALDAGAVLVQECFPLDAAPDGDPMEYVERFRREVLAPNGVRLLTQAVRGIAEGRLEGRPQDATRATTYPRPDFRAVRELRRRVKSRRAARRGAGEPRATGRAP